MIEKTNRFALPIFIALVLVASIVYYFFIHNPKTLRQEYLEIKDSYYESEDKEQSIKALEDLLSKASSKDDEVLIKSTLAFAYIRIGELKRGISLIKYVISDESLSAERRALAAQHMADIFMLGGRFLGNLSNEIFSGEPYASFKENTSNTRQWSENTKVLVGMRRIYEYASSISSLPVGEYRNAESYAKLFVNSQLDKAVVLSNKKEHYVVIAEEKIVSGDAAFERFAARRGSWTEQGYALWVKGVALDLLNELTGEAVYAVEAEDAFKNSLLLLEKTKDKNRSIVRSQKIWAAFYYASFLERKYGDGRRDDILSLLAAVTNKEIGGGGDTPGLWKYLSRIGAMSGPGGMQASDKRNAVILAKKNSDFRAFLQGLGWTNNALN